MEHQQTNAAAFDPAAWLARFREVGGWWTVGAGRCITIGWRINEPADRSGDRPRAMWSEVERDRLKREAIKALLTEGAA